MNRKFSFTTKAEFMDFLVNKQKFPASRIVYLEPESFVPFFPKKTMDMTIFYGTFLNDSTVLKKSALFLDNPSCSGRVISDINSPAVETEASNFHSYRLRYAQNDSSFTMNTIPKKHKILLQYYYLFGTYYNSAFNELLQYQQQNKNDVDLYIIVPELTTLQP